MLSEKKQFSQIKVIDIIDYLAVPLFLMIRYNSDVTSAFASQRLC